MMHLKDLRSLNLKDLKVRIVWGVGAQIERPLLGNRLKQYKFVQGKGVHSEWLNVDMPIRRPTSKYP